MKYANRSNVYFTIFYAVKRLSGKQCCSLDFDAEITLFCFDTLMHDVCCYKAEQDLTSLLLYDVFRWKKYCTLAKKWSFDVGT